MPLTPSALLDQFGATRASAILRTHDADAAAPAMEAAVRAGFTVIEFTLTTPGALEQIAAFSERDGLAVGAGTVLSVEQANAAIDAGASFLVSPVVDPEVIAVGTERNIAMMPGTHTPTEMFAAHRAGAQLQKLFPAPGIGAKFVKSCLGPMPFLRIVPTNGVHENNVASFLKAGAFAVGFVAPLFDPNAMQQGDWDRIEERGRVLLEAVKASG